MLLRLICVWSRCVRWKRFNRSCSRDCRRASVAMSSRLRGLRRLMSHAYTVLLCCSVCLKHCLKLGPLVAVSSRRFTDICSPDKCSQDLILAREICQYGHRRYLTNYFYRTMHYSTKHGLAIAVLFGRSFHRFSVCFWYDVAIWSAT